MRWNRLFRTEKRPVLNSVIHCIIRYNGLDYTCGECILSKSFRFIFLTETLVSFVPFFLK